MRYNGQAKAGTKLPHGKKLKKPVCTTKEGASAIKNAHYMPLEPCPNGHHSLHTTKSDRCLTCQRLKLI